LRRTRIPAIDRIKKQQPINLNALFAQLLGRKPGCLTAA